jgi:hypothetical protein
VGVIESDAAPTWPPDTILSMRILAATTAGSGHFLPKVPVLDRPVYAQVSRDGMTFICLPPRRRHAGHRAHRRDG